MINQQTSAVGASTPAVGADAPSTSKYNPLTQSDIDKHLKAMEYDLAK